MTFLLSLSRAIDWINTTVGRIVMWLVLVMVLVSAGNAAIRYAFDMSSNAWLEMQWYMFSAVFMLTAGYTLLRNEHIRIDIVNSRLSKKTRNIIELVGLGLFLFPLCIMMLYESYPYFMESFVNTEMSSNAGGLVRWPVKLLLLVGFFLLLLQGVSEMIKRVAVMMDLIPEPYEKRGGH